MTLLTEKIISNLPKGSYLLHRVAGNNILGKLTYENYINYDEKTFYKLPIFNVIFGQINRTKWYISFPEDYYLLTEEEATLIILEN